MASVRGVHGVSSTGGTDTLCVWRGTETEGTTCFVEGFVVTVVLCGGKGLLARSPCVEAACTCVCMSLYVCVRVSG